MNFELRQVSMSDLLAEIRHSLYGGMSFLDSSNTLLIQYLIS